jgi:2-polyprenyl-3-methyl-5-hydroxy-6-metoxy-1,4-benzoquinol methylase
MTAMETQLTQTRLCPCCESSAVKVQRTMGGENLMECAACGSVYAARVPDAETLSHTYEKLYSDGGVYQEHRDQLADMREGLRTGKPYNVGWERRYFFRHVLPKPGDRLLDIGCGTGFFICAAKMRGWEAQGIELSSEAAKIGASVHGLPVQNIRFEDFHSDQKFAAMTAWEVAEHIVNPREFLLRIRGMLAPGGVFAGSIPNYARPKYRFGEDLGIASIPPVHLNFWTPQALKTTLEKAGFKDVVTSYPKICTDFLTMRRLTLGKALRFVSVALGADIPTTLFFMARA